MKFIIAELFVGIDWSKGHFQEKMKDIWLSHRLQTSTPTEHSQNGEETQRFDYTIRTDL